MIAKIQGVWVGVKKIQKKGTQEVFWSHKLLIKDREGVPYMVDVFSSKNNRKPGQQEFNVSIKCGAKDGVLTGMLAVSEV